MNMTVEERKLRAAQFNNELLLKLLENQFDPEAIARLKVMMKALNVVSEHDPEYFEGFIKRVESNL